MHTYSLWVFILLFTFLWVVFYVSDAAFVSVDGVVSKSLCAWYALAIAVSIVVIFWLAALIMRWIEIRAIRSVGGDMKKRSGSALRKLEKALI